MNLRQRIKKTVVLPETSEQKSKKTPEVPNGLLKKCNKCGKGVYTKEVAENKYICPKCGGYLRMPAAERIHDIADEGSFEEWNCGLETENPLRLKEYPEKVKALREKTGLDEAVLTGKCSIEGTDAVIMVMDGRFLTGSMGYVVGEKITRAVEQATKEKLPVILFTLSGGARMQEGMTSLMQMAKTSAALKQHSEAGLLYVPILTDPTTGGVTASFAMLGDIILAEPKALVGFAGPRVIEQTIRQKLPKGFQRSEFLLEHGFIDKIVKREEMRETIAKILRLHKDAGPEESLENTESEKKKNKWDASYRKKASEKTAWERVQLSRKNDRPVGEDYIALLFDGFMEMHGDRQFGDDGAICGGIALFHDKPVTVIAQMKGRNTQENLKRNFGMPNPEGYRKALRLMKQAEKFHRPVICLVDTPGAYPGMEAEERGQGEAIARNLFEMSSLKTPILSILIGEGGSGGALAMAVADEVWILENAVYSILSPEGFASILWKDAKGAPKAAKAMRLTSYDLYKAGFVEKIFKEPEGYTIDFLVNVCDEIEESLEKFLKDKMKMNKNALIKQRYQRFRAY